MREFEGCKKKAEGKDIWGKIEVTTEKLANRALKKHGKKETASSERSWDASLGAPQAEVPHCIYIALSAKYPKAIHSVCWAVRVLALTPITNTHLAPWGRTPHLVYDIHMPVSAPVFEKSCPPSPTLFHNGCQAHVCDHGMARETSRSFQWRNGKKLSALKQGFEAHNRIIRLSYIFCCTQPHGSQLTAGWE